MANKRLFLPNLKIMTKAICDLSSCLLCASCHGEWDDLTALKKQTRLYKKGERIFTEGEPSEGMFFTLSGAVKVHQHWGDRELIIRFVSGNDILGARGFGDNHFRVSATALEATKACFIPNDHLKASLVTNPQFCYKLMEFYAKELQRAEQRMNDLAHRSVKGRIATTLLLLEETFSTSQEGFINVTISREDIASFSGTIYETVFKTFNEWTQVAAILTEGKKIKILQPGVLLAALL